MRAGPLVKEDECMKEWQMLGRGRCLDVADAWTWQMLGRGRCLDV